MSNKSQNLNPLANINASSQAQKELQGRNPIQQVQNGIYTANAEDSGRDANPLQTQTGSLASLNNNTENSKLSPMQSPLTQGVNTNDQYSTWANQYNEHIAQNNLSGQADDLIQLNNNEAQPIEAPNTQNNVSQIGNIQGQDIKQSMQNINNRTIASYERKINNAKLDGNYEKAEALQDQLDEFYAVNGITNTTTTQPITYETSLAPEQEYQTQLDQINEKYDNAYKVFETNYQQMYASVLNDVTNGIVAQLGNLLNFQYDPTKDRALHVAQGYAVSQVKEVMNATGMYYSTMTQSAITKAISELVPVYEKMSKEEIQTNLQMLNSVGNYLMNLETQQFNLWKSQIELKIEELEQKRKDVSEAWERANNLGYIDNQASAILGVEAGTLTYKARKDAQDRQDAIDKELRGYDQQEYMARLNDYLQTQRMKEEAKIAIAQLQEQSRLQDIRDANSALRDYQYKSQLQKEQYELQGKLVSSVDGKPTYRTGKMKATQMENYYYDLVDNLGYSNEEAIEEVLNNGTDDSERSSFLASIGEDPKKWLGSTTTDTQPNTPSGIDTDELKKNYGKISETARNLIKSKDVLDKLQGYYDKEEKTLADFEGIIKGMKQESSEAGDIDYTIWDVICGNSGFNSELEENTKNFSKDFSSTSNALKDSFALIDSYMEMLDNLGYDEEDRAKYGEYMYKKLIDQIADSKEMDMSWTNFNDKTEEAKDRAIKQMIERLDNSKDEATVKFNGAVQQYAREKVPVYVAEGTNKPETEHVPTEQEKKIAEREERLTKKIYASKEVQDKVKALTNKVKNGGKLSEADMKYLNEQKKLYSKVDSDGRIYYTTRIGL